MYPPRINVDPTANAKRLLCRLLVLRVSDGHFATANKVRSQAGVRVRRVVSMSMAELRKFRGWIERKELRRDERTVGPDEDVLEAPAADGGLVIRAAISHDFL